MKLKKGDQIQMLAGKDKGKKGKIIKADVQDGRIVVEGLNTVKKHVRPKKSGQKGEIVLVPRPFPASRAALVCANCGKPTRVGHRFEGDKKVRYCKKCEATT